jgi:hypothetical protein
VLSAAPCLRGEKSGFIVPERTEVIIATATDESALRERAFASLCDIDLCGVAAVSDAAGTPLHDSAALLMPEARSIARLFYDAFKIPIGKLIVQIVDGDAKLCHFEPAAKKEVDWHLVREKVRSLRTA